MHAVTSARDMCQDIYAVMCATSYFYVISQRAADQGIQTHDSSVHSVYTVGPSRSSVLHTGYNRFVLVHVTLLSKLQLQLAEHHNDAEK